MATHSSILAWRIPGRGEPGGLPSMGSQSWTQLKRLSSSSRLFNSFPSGTSGKEPACQCRRHKRHRVYPWVRKIHWRRAWQPVPAFLLGDSPWTVEPGGLQSTELQRVRHDLAPELTCTPAPRPPSLQPCTDPILFFSVPVLDRCSSSCWLPLLP